MKFEGFVTRKYAITITNHHKVSINITQESKRMQSRQIIFLDLSIIRVTEKFILKYLVHVFHKHTEVNKLCFYFEKVYLLTHSRSIVTRLGQRIAL